VNIQQRLIHIDLPWDNDKLFFYNFDKYYWENYIDLPQDNGICSIHPLNFYTHHWPPLLFESLTSVDFLICFLKNTILALIDSDVLFNFSKQSALETFLPPWKQTHKTWSTHVFFQVNFMFLLFSRFALISSISFLFVVYFVFLEIVSYAWNWYCQVVLWKSTDVLSLFEFIIWYCLSESILWHLVLRVLVLIPISYC
jgi:hypothetical protein